MLALNSDELLRYERQLIIPGWNEAVQMKLKESAVFVAGAGGLGSPVLLYLAAAGIGTIRLCDFDNVDLSNLNRQIIHSEKRIRDRKVDSAAATVHDLNSGVTIITCDEKLSASNAGRIIGDVDLIIDCLDNLPTRFILNLHSVKRGIPLLHAGVSEMQGQITFLHPPHTPCLACFMPTKTSNKRIPILGATAGILGSLQALEAIKYLSGTGEPLENRLLLFSGKDMRFDSIAIRKNERCRVCG